MISSEEACKGSEWYSGVVNHQGFIVEIGLCSAIGNKKGYDSDNCHIET